MRIDVNAAGGGGFNAFLFGIGRVSSNSGAAALGLGALASLSFGQNPFGPGLGGLLSHLPSPAPTQPTLGLLNTPNTEGRFASQGVGPSSFDVIFDSNAELEIGARLLSNFSPAADPQKFGGPLRRSVML